MHFLVREQTVWIAFVSAADSSIVCSARGVAVVGRVVGPLRTADVTEALGVRRLADDDDADRLVRHLLGGVSL